MTMKIVLLGDSCVGKTCLINQYVNNKFTIHCMATIGVDFRIKDLVIDHRVISMQVSHWVGSYQIITSM